MKLVKVLTGLSVCVAIALVCVFVFSSGSSASQNTTVVNLNGTWHQSLNDTTKVDMTADVTNGHIEIMMSSTAIDGLYWSGSFDSNVISNSYNVVSVSDQQGLSQDKTKIFTYKNGVLSYEFTMLGQSQTVHLSQGE